VDKSVAELNIEHYRKLLASADLEETKRKTVENLLAAEQEKLSQIKSDGRPPRPCPNGNDPAGR
jgi:hypothetical protein